MKDSIVNKLRAVLDGRIDSECKVSYLLCECRKLLEKYPPDPSPFALSLYCNWALHIDLDRPRTTLAFLKRVDEFVGSVFAGANADIVLEHHVFREFVFMDTFRAQLQTFLTAYGLPTSVCDEDQRWHEFVTHYAGIIEDGSLSCDGKNLPLKWVSEVVFMKGRARADAHVPFDLCWQIELLDGRSILVDVYAPDSPLRMIVHGLTFKPAAVVP
jgi:hypothetical protein